MSDEQLGLNINININSDKNKSINKNADDMLLANRQVNIENNASGMKKKEKVASAKKDILKKVEFNEVKDDLENIAQDDYDEIKILKQWEESDQGSDISVDYSDNLEALGDLTLTNDLNRLLTRGKDMMAQALPRLKALDDNDDSTGYFKKLIRITERVESIWDGLSELDKFNVIRLYTHYADDYYESHRGHRFTKRGKDRKEAVNVIRNGLIGFTADVKSVLPEEYQKLIDDTTIMQLESHVDNAMSREEKKGVEDTDETTYVLKKDTDEFSPIAQINIERIESKIVKSDLDKTELARLRHDYKDSRTKHMREYGIGSVRAAVAWEMMGAYDVLEQKKNSENIEEKTVKLHRARGKKFRQEDENNCVLKFDMGGSGNKVFPIASKNLDTSGNIKLQDKTKIKIKEIKKSDYAKLTDEEINEIKVRNEYIRNLNYETYGEDFQMVNGKRIKGVRKREQQEGKKTKITMSGPDAFSGWVDSGKYKIDNLKGYMLEMAKEYIKNRVAKMKDTGKMGKIRLQIRGHSRGAVAANEGALAILDWIEKEYAGEENKPIRDAISFDILEFDPVPGPLNNIMGYYDDTDNAKMDRLNAKSETTVVYSLHTQHAVGFVPLKLAHAKRIILTPDYHNAGIKFSEKTGEGENEKQHMKSYIDASTGEAYRNSGLQELPEGIYLADENNVLVKLTKYSDAKRVLDRVWKHTSMQGDRHDMILSILRERLGDDSVNE